MSETGMKISVEAKFYIYTKFLDRTLISEGIIRDGETRQQALLRVHKELEETAEVLRRQAHPHLYQEQQRFSEWMAPTPPPENWEIQKDNPQTVFDSILDSETLEELKTYKTIAASDTTKKLYNAYSQRLKELTINSHGTDKE